MEKWKASNNVFGSKVYRVESNEMDVAAFDPIQAECLAADLNELEAYRDERRWRVIGEEMPSSSDVQWVQLARPGHIEEKVFYTGWLRGELCFIEYEDGYAYKADGAYTHWRPVPTDPPVSEKE